MKKITAKEAAIICDRQGLGHDDQDVTFWAYDEDHDEVYDFDTRKERDEFVARHTAEA